MIYKCIILHVMQLPSYKGFKGTIEELATNQYMHSGEVAILDSTTIEISELPIKTWTQVSSHECLISYVLPNHFFSLPFRNVVLSPSLWIRPKLHYGFHVAAVERLRNCES